MHQCLIGGMRWFCGSDHDRMQTVISSSMSTTRLNWSKLKTCRSRLASATSAAPFPPNRAHGASAHSTAEVCVEKTQEDVQGADESPGDRGRAPRIAQGYCPPKYVHSEAWSWRRTNKCGIRFLRRFADYFVMCLKVSVIIAYCQHVPSKSLKLTLSSFLSFFLSPLLFVFLNLY